MKALELKNVYYKQTKLILKNISFSLEEGDTVALTGRSGAGKSTLIKVIGNALWVDSGIIQYFGKELYEDEYNIRKNMSVVFDKTNFNTEMKAVNIAKEIMRFEPDFDTEGFERRMTFLGLDSSMKIRLYSSGMKKKFMLVIALCRNPKLLIMDEPTSEVDEVSRDEMWDLITEYRMDKSLTILFSTHREKEIERYSNKRIHIEKGECREEVL